MHRVIFIAWNYNFFSSFCSLFFGQFVSVQIINNKFNANCSGNATNEFLMKFLSIINWSAVTKNVMKITIFYQNRFVHIFVVVVCVFSCSQCNKKLWTGIIWISMKWMNTKQLCENLHFYKIVLLQYNCETFSILFTKMHFKN